MDPTFMKEKKVLPLVLSMALPMAGGMLVNALYNIIDSFFVARFSAEAMTALSLIFPLQNIVGAVSIGFGVGLNAAVAWFLGAGKKREADESASVGLLLAALHGVLLTITLLTILRPFLQLFHARGAVLSYGLAYGRTVILFSVVISVQIAFEKLFQAVGRMKISMLSMMIGCIANILLDPLLIFGIGPFPAMGITGAAIATNIGNALTLLSYLLFAAAGRLGLSLHIHPLHRQWRLAGRLYLVGIPASLNQALPSVLISALNGILTGFSGNGILILGIYYKLQTFIFLPANGIVQGIRPLAGYNYGAGELGRLKKISDTALFLSLGIMAAGMALCLIVPGRLMGLFLADPALIGEGARALRIISLSFLPAAFSLTFSGMLEGMGKGMHSLVIMLMRFLIVILPAALLLTRLLESPAGVWHAFWVSEWITMTVALLLYRGTLRQAAGTQRVTVRQPVQ